MCAIVFACVEAALTSVSTARLGALERETRERLRASLQRAMTLRERVQASYLMGRLLGTVLAVLGFARLVQALGGSPRDQIALAGSGLFVFALALYAATLLGRHLADMVLPYGLFLLRPAELVLLPAAELIRHLTRLFPPLRPKPDPRVAESEVELIVDQQERSGALDVDRGEMIRNVLEFSELTARDAMIPRTKVNAIQLGTPIEDVIMTILQTGHSRYPVYREAIDDVFGLLYSKDLFRVAKSSWYPPPNELNGGNGETPSRRAARLLDIVREPIKIVSESQPLPSLLKEMRQNRQHLAVVVDEFGGFIGIVTLEDILEEIVGDIQDETDAEEAPIIEMGPGRVLADAAVCLSDLSAYLGSELDPEGQYDSLGGMLTDKVGSVPEEGTRIAAYGMRFIVRESDAKHISKVEILKGSAPSADASGSHSVVAP